MQKYALTFRICNNDHKPSKYAFAYAHMHFKKIRALFITQRRAHFCILRSLSNYAVTELHAFTASLHLQ
jgi:hypothetical protein